jgi:hypothetical protein
MTMIGSGFLRLAVTAALVAGLPAAVVADSAQAGKRPSGFVRACGKVKAHRHHLRVDIAEGNGKLITCRQARKVMRRFLRTRRTDFRAYGRKWGCYKSRADGQGWGYHCSTEEPYVDVGAGRRW